MPVFHHRPLIIGLLLLILVVFASLFTLVYLRHSSFGNQTSGNQATATDSPHPGYMLQTVTYCSPNQIAQQMDIYTPTGHSSRLRPVVEMVHGGGWTGDSKGTIHTIQPVPEVPNALLGLLAHGFVVTSINYRLAPQYKFPDNIEDVKCSIRYLRAHAVQYNIDPRRIGLIGSSAGGHLVSLAGLAGQSAGWDVGEYTNQSSAVQAVVDMFGPEYLDSHIGNPAMSDPTIFGSAPGVLVQASPPTYISKTPNTDPPFLIIQGNEDKTVPPYHSARFYQALIAAGQPAFLHVIHNAGHELIPIPSNATISPSADQISEGIIHFFVQYLGQSATT